MGVLVENGHARAAQPATSVMDDFDDELRGARLHPARTSLTLASGKITETGASNIH